MSLPTSKVSDNSSQDKRINTDNPSTQAILQFKENQTYGQGCCRTDALSTFGQKAQQVKILFLALFPIIGVGIFTVYTLADHVMYRTDVQTARESIGVAISLGTIVHRLQRERDMSVLYLSDLGPGTRAYLIREYQNTDDALVEIASWPETFSQSSLPHFRTTLKLMKYISTHRNMLETSQMDIHSVTNFYSSIIFFMKSLYDNISETGFGKVWQGLVAYQKLSRCKEEVGIERAYGSRFFVKGTFPTWDEFDFYLQKINYFRYLYKTAAYYSTMVDQVLQVTSNDLSLGTSSTNITDYVRLYRSGIQNFNRSVDYRSVQNAQFWFDNVTLYMDTLLSLQQEVALKVLEKVSIELEAALMNVILYASTIVIVFALTPIITLSAGSLATNMQTFTLILAEKTIELEMEKQKADSVLYQLLPPTIAEGLKVKKSVESEYFKSATVLFSDIYRFSRLYPILTPMELVDVMNSLYTSMDEQIGSFDVYKVETINDCYMVASGLPQRNGSQHVSEIAILAISLQGMMARISRLFPESVQHLIQLRIGISTGPCMAGIVGKKMLRYCLFGDTVNIASRMKSYGLPSRIHISESTFRALQKQDTFFMKERGDLEIKGKGTMKTFWLLSQASDDDIMFRSDIPSGYGLDDPNALPGSVPSDDYFPSAKKVTKQIKTTEQRKCTKGGHVDMGQSLDSLSNRTTNQMDASSTSSALY